jgi:polyhydroxyalkanoate synthesis regulator phasin
MKTPKTLTYIPERIKPEHIYAYGHALWALSLQQMDLGKMLQLRETFNVGRNLPDQFVEAGILKKDKKGGKIIFVANHSIPPSKEECWNCYKNQTQKVNECKAKSEPSPELFTQEPAIVQELTVESLAQQVLKLTEIMNKLVTQTPTQNP